jgi:hypothetical protein
VVGEGGRDGSGDVTALDGLDSDAHRSAHRRGFAAVVGGDGESAPAAGGVVVGDGDDVAQVAMATGLEVDRAVQAGVPPVVLVLDPGGVAVAHDHDGEGVRAGDEMGGQVELAGEA